MMFGNLDLDLHYQIYKSIKDNFKNNFENMSNTFGKYCHGSGKLTLTATCNRGGSVQFTVNDKWVEFDLSAVKNIYGTLQAVVSGNKEVLRILRDEKPMWQNGSGKLFLSSPDGGYNLFFEIEGEKARLPVSTVENIVDALDRWISGDITATNSRSHNCCSARHDPENLMSFDPAEEITVFLIKDGVQYAECTADIYTVMQLVNGQKDYADKVEIMQ